MDLFTVDLIDTKSRLIITNEATLENTYVCIVKEEFGPTLVLE